MCLEAEVAVLGGDIQVIHFYHIGTVENVQKRSPAAGSEPPHTKCLYQTYIDLGKMIQPFKGKALPGGHHPGLPRTVGPSR